MASVDVLRSNEKIRDLKIIVKKWEKKFENEFGRKPKKEDIDQNEEIKANYLVYWNMIKFKKKSEKNDFKKDSFIKNIKDTWGESCKKKLIVDNEKTSNQKFIFKNKAFNTLSNKLLTNEITKSTSNNSYSLQRKKSNPFQENKIITINSYKINLLKRNSLESSHFTDENVDNSLNQVDETDQEIKEELNFIVQKLEKEDESASNYILPECNSLENQLSNSELNVPVFNFIENSNFVDMNQQTESNNFAIKEDLNTYNTENSEHIFSTEKQTETYDEVDFGFIMPQLFENFNTTTKDNFNSFGSKNLNFKQENFNSSTNFTDSTTFYNTNGYNNEKTYDNSTNMTMSNSSNAMDVINDFSPVKNDIPIEKLNFSNIVKSLNCYDTDFNSKTTSMDSNNFVVEKIPDVYDFQYYPENEKKIEKPVKASVKKLTKNKKKEANNFRKLNMKKKVFVRGHKKFNVNKYKKDQWKKFHNENKCFQCGEKDHWAYDCPSMNKDLKTSFNENSDELEDMAFDKVFINTGNKFLDENESLESLDLKIKNALHEFGFESFRPNQEQVIKRVLLGKSCLMISSTGSGKSICYQIPAFIYHRYKKYITLVVSPLISLMEDQIACLPKPLKAVCLHSGLNSSLKKTQLEKIQKGDVQVLFVSPEYILSHLFELNLLPTIGFVCIDEAHCLSEWSNNFRPSYLQFFSLLKEKVKIKTFLALTATSNKATTTQILKNISLNSEDVVGETKVPENLVLTVSRDTNKDIALINLLKSDRFFDLSSIIIYCSRREITERLATKIRIEMQKNSSDLNWNVKPYHAGLSYQERKKIQKSFINGEVRVVVATIAFGMGINKSDVDGIIHYNLPKTIENYVQEIGRAGRNGKNAQCHVFLDHDMSDLFEQQRHIYSNGVDKVNIKKLVTKIFNPCKCAFLKEESLEDSSKRCIGHEKAFPVKELTEDFDIKEETLMTILIFLELNLTNFKIEVYNKTFSNCILSCYKGGSQQLENLAKKYVYIGLPYAKQKKESQNFENQTLLKFSYIDIASMLGQPSLEIKRKLKNLEYNLDDKLHKTKSNIRISFDTNSFHLKTPGDLKENELQEVCKIILNYSKCQEILQIQKLKNLYDLLKDCSQSKSLNKINFTKSHKLKKALNDYFNLSVDDQFEQNLCLDNLEKIASQVLVLRETSLSELEETRREIRDLLCIHSDQHFTARAIVRILQGISSPKYPIEIWGKDKRFWRQKIKIDFNILMKIANEELIRIKCKN